MARARRYNDLQRQYPIGTRVIVRATAHSVKDAFDEMGRAHAPHRHIESKPIRWWRAGEFGPRTQAGIVVGCDYMPEGFTRRYGYEDPPSWYCTGTVPVLLVAISYGRRIRCLPADVEIVSNADRKNGGGDGPIT